MVGFVIGARAKLHGTIAVIMLLHEQTTDALAVVAALPIVSGGFAKVSVHFDLILLRKKQRRAGSVGFGDDPNLRPAA